MALYSGSTFIANNLLEFRNKLQIGFLLRYMIQLTVMKKKTATNEKPPIDLKTFVENVNKKDKKRNGLKIRFAFVNRKRKG